MTAQTEMLFEPAGTLEDAKALIRQNWKKGIHCPCCGQTVRLARYKVDNAQSRFLIWLVRSYLRAPGWYNRTDAPLMQGVRGGGSYSKLRWWGLTEPCPNTKDAPVKYNPNLPSNRSGFWRPTAFGIEFAQRRAAVPKWVYLFNNQSFGFEGDDVTIDACLPEYFNFWETWGAD